MWRLWLICFALLTSALPARAQGRLNVVASFSILGDLVQNVGGDRVSVTTLVGPDGDVHVYTPAPTDARKIADAKLLVINGLGLEGWLPRLLQASGGKAPIITASRGIAPLQVGSVADPHAWQSVANVRVYVTNIRDALVSAQRARYRRHHHPDQDGKDSGGVSGEHQRCQADPADLGRDRRQGRRDAVFRQFDRRKGRCPHLH